MTCSTCRRITLLLVAVAQGALAPPAIVGQEDADGVQEAERVEDPLTGDATFGLTVAESNSETLSLNFVGCIAYEMRHQAIGSSSNGSPARPVPTILATT